MKLQEGTSWTGKRIDLFHCSVVSTPIFSGWLHPNPTYIPLTGNSSSQQDMWCVCIYAEQESPAKGTSSSVTPSPPTHSHLRIIGSSSRMKRTAVRSSHGSKQQCSKDADNVLSSISSKYLRISFDYFSFIMFLLKDSA